jgi:hypothetical protein
MEEESNESVFFFFSFEKVEKGHEQVERRFSNARWLVSSPGQKYMNDSEKNDFELCQKAS